MVSKDQWMNDQVAFEFALRRVQNRERGQKRTFHDLLKLATKEMEEEYEKLNSLSSLPENATQADAVEALAKFLKGPEAESTSRGTVAPERSGA